METLANDKLRLGISTCLLGEKVRYDGQHKFDAFLVNTLGPFVQWYPVCPEVETGLPIPREALRLVGDPSAPRLLTVQTKIDHTDNMLHWAAGKLAELERADLHGYIFKSKSPSSGMERVKVYNEKGVAVKQGVGIFARAFMDRFPLLPVEEEGRLHDPLLRENFIERIFTVKRWRDMHREDYSRHGLIEFHTRHKLLLLAHSTEEYRNLGRIVAHSKEHPFDEVVTQYQLGLLHALQLKTTVKKNVNVLHHVMGYFKKNLSADEKQELLAIIDDYADNHYPLIVPITLLNHYVRKYQQPYLAEQYYLKPHPVELRLRNHA